MLRDEKIAAFAAPTRLGCTSHQFGKYITPQFRILPKSFCPRAAQPDSAGAPVFQIVRVVRLSERLNFAAI
jgi:hypothetical protein